MKSEGKSSILLVEDDLTIAKLKMQQLKKKGYKVHHVTTGENAVQTILENTLPIDLIMMDIDLGSGIDGAQAAEQILSHKDIPVVFVSSHTEPEIIEKTEKILSYGYIVKDSGATVIDASIKMALQLFEAKTQEKMQKIALRESSNRLEAILEALDDAVFLVEPTTRKILQCNNATMQIFGYSRKELTDLKTDILHIDQEHFEQFGQAALVAYDNPGYFKTEFKMKRKDGTMFPSEHYVHPLRDQDGRVMSVVSLVRDITERRYAETKIAESRKLLAQAQEMVHVGSWQLNLNTNRLSWSDEVYRIFGCEPPELPLSYDTFLDYVHPDDRAAVDEAYSRSLQEGKDGYETVHRIVQRDSGEVRYVHERCYHERDETGAVIQSTGMVHDITEAKRAEDELRRFKTITDKAVYGKAIGDLQGNLLYVNRFFAIIHGYEPEELVGKHFSLFHNKQQIGAADNLIATMIQEGNFTPTIVWHCHLDGTEFPMLMSGILVKDDFGNPQYIACSAIDVTDQFVSEQALHKSEERYRRISEDMPLLICRFMPDYTISYVNRAYCAYFGKSPDELVDTSFLTPIPKADHKAVKSAISSLTVDLPVVSQEHQVLMPDQTVRWQKWIHRALFDEKKGIIAYQSIGEDITEQMQIRAELRKNEEKYRDLVENIDEYIYSIEYENGQVAEMYHSQKSEKVTGYTPAEYKENPELWFSMVHADDVAGLLDYLAEIRSGKQLPPIEHRINHKNGSIRWVLNHCTIKINENGDPALSQGFIIDITERKNTENSLKEATIRQELAAKAGGVGIWDYDCVHNQLIWDERMHSLYGISKEEFSGAYDAWLSGLHPDDAERCHKEIELALEGKKDFNTEFRVVWPDGSVHYIRGMALVIRGANNDPLHIIGTNWDITDQKKVQSELQEQTAKANTMAALAKKANTAKSEFLANMSHEIRTPLNSVIGFTELLRETNLTPEQMQYVHNAVTSGHLLMRIINDILDFSKIEAGMMQLEIVQTDLIELLKSIIHLFEIDSDKKHIGLRLSIAPEMPRFAMVDPVRLQQVLANLLSNAVKFTRQGEVELRASCKPMKDKQWKFFFSVRDTGIGIHDEQKKQLFKAFSQADSSITRKFGGTGLGLLISQIFVNKMNGNIDFESSPDEGSVFFFDIIAEAEYGEKPDDSTDIEEHEKSAIPLNAEILLAEDDRMNMILLKNFLKRLLPDARIYEATTGIEAIELYIEEQPDVILMDVQMPEMDGIEATKNIRKLEESSGRQVYIAALTGDVFHDEGDNCLAAGMNDFLTKPFSIEKLRYTLNRAFTIMNCPATNSPVQFRELSSNKTTGTDSFNLLHAAEELMFSVDEYTDLLEMVLKKSAEIVESLNTAFISGDSSVLSARAHKLSGMAYNMRFTNLAGYAENIERTIRAGSIAGCEKDISGIKEEILDISNAFYMYKKG